MLGLGCIGVARARIYARAAQRACQEGLCRRIVPWQARLERGDGAGKREAQRGTFRVQQQIAGGMLWRSSRQGKPSSGDESAAHVRLRHWVQEAGRGKGGKE